MEKRILLISSLLIFILINIFTIQLSQASVIRSVASGSGSWKNTSSWQGGVIPSTNGIDTVIIQAGFTMSIPHGGGHTQYNGVLIVYGTLEIIGQLIMNASSSILFATGSSVTATGPGASDKISIGNQTISDNEITAITTPNTLNQGNLRSGGTGMDPLPVKLLSFSGRVTAQTIQLIWSTASEKNFDFFTVERSHDFTNFAPVGTLKGSGNSNGVVNYSFKDESPLQGDNFYRLKATDFDGSVEYHQIIKIVNTDHGKPGFGIYPNPLIGQSFNIFTSLDHGILKIYNVHGKEVFQGPIGQGNQFQIGKSLDPGLYVVVAENEIKKNQTKLTVK